MALVEQCRGLLVPCRLPNIWRAICACCIALISFANTGECATLYAAYPQGGLLLIDTETNSVREVWGYDMNPDFRDVGQIVLNPRSNTLYATSTRLWISDGSKEPDYIRAISTSERKVVATLAFPGQYVLDLIMGASGKALYAVLGPRQDFATQIAIIDCRTNSISRTINLPVSISGAAISPDESFALAPKHAEPSTALRIDLTSGSVISHSLEYSYKGVDNVIRTGRWNAGSFRLTSDGLHFYANGAVSGAEINPPPTFQKLSVAKFSAETFESELLIAGNEFNHFSTPFREPSSTALVFSANNSYLYAADDGGYAVAVSTLTDTFFGNLLDNPIGAYTVFAASPANDYVYVAQWPYGLIAYKEDTLELATIKGVPPNWRWATGLAMSMGGVTLIDPAPLYSGDALSMLDGNEIATQPARLAQGGRVVTGVAADGVSRLLLRVPAASAGETITFTLSADRCGSLTPDDCGALYDPLNPISQSAGASISVKSVTVDNEVFAFAAYVAPMDFVRVHANAEGTPDANLGERVVGVSIVRAGQAPETAAIKVVRAPVALVHGNWSGPTSWNAFSLLSSDKRFFAQPINYSEALKRGIDAGRGPATEQLQDNLRDYRLYMKVAASQHDVVAYSMGGLLMRSLPLFAPFSEGFPYGAGGIHKLIALDTPHLGSEFAALQWDSPMVCKGLFELLSRNAVGNNVLDMVPQSSFLTRINITGRARNHIVAHAVVGLASERQIAASESTLYATNRVVNLACPFILGRNGYADVFPGQQHDLVVSAGSQSAFGLGVRGSVPYSTNIINTIHTVNPFVYPIGPDAQAHALLSDGSLGSSTVSEQQAIVGHVIDLLNSPKSGSSFAPIRP